MKLIFTLAAFIISFITDAQEGNQDSIISCIANWKKGDRKQYMITHGKNSYRNNQQTSQFVITYEARIEVLEKNFEGYMIEWIFNLPDSFVRRNPQLAKALPIYNGLRMIFKTDTTGRFGELINWQEVKDAYIDMMMVSMPKKPDSLQQYAIDKAKAMFDTRQMVESALIKEIILVHNPFGVQFSTTEVTDTFEIPNPMGYDPLPAVGTTAISEINDKEGFFTVKYTQHLDKEGSKRVVQDIFRKLGVPEDKTMQETAAQLSNMNTDATINYRILKAKGWVLDMNYEQVISTDPMMQKEFFIIRSR